MNETKLSEIMLVLLLIGMLTLAFNVPRVEAAKTSDGGVCTVVIQADGSVDPPTAPIQRQGSVYTLTGNITCSAFSDGIVIERNNMILDGAGYTLQGISGSEAVGGAESGRGITLSSGSNVTIRNLRITTFSWGILLLVNSFNNSILRNIITDNGNIGLQVDHSWNNSISGNTIIDNNLGLLIVSSPNNSIYYNNFINNTQQVYTTTPSYTNIWDQGYPSGGNYWSDYTGGDVYGGPLQNTNVSDGIGDFAYVIDRYNRDHYPLMTDPSFEGPPVSVRVAPVGCTQIPINKLKLLTPYISLISMILATVATITIYAKHERKKR